MAPEPIQYFHRAKQVVETERIYGEAWLRWTYGSPLGRLSLDLLLKRAIVSAFYGWRMDRRASANQVLPFIVEYDLDVDEFAKNPFAFKTFNEFFYRALKPGKRPIAEGDRVAVLPADGRHLAFQDMAATAGFYAKGQQFDLRSFLGDQELSARFGGGAMLISRLCPVDYHRFHFPVGGNAGAARLINGYLHSVSPIALRRNLAYLWQNKRMVTLVESPVFGQVAVCEVGATMVGTIFQTYLPDKPVAKGEEKGLFKFGASMVITLFQRGRIKLDPDLLEQSAQGREVYARMGERLGIAP
ncbi:MAG TPA: phosphatidylserine decarboxylase [Lacunisphaera sp.]|nr:phosphatidylserine decarboxylase [Lacunisphaera sp.]